MHPGDGSADTDPATRADAIARFEAFAVALEHIGLEDLRQVVVGTGDAAARIGWREAAEAIAAERGLTDVLQAARSAVREHVSRVYASGGFRPTWAGLNWGISTGSAADQASAIEAAEDAVAAAIVEPFADEEVLDGLRGPYDLIAGAHPMPPAGGEIIPLVRPDGSPVFPLPLIVLIAVASIVALAVGGWVFVVIPVLVVGFLRRRRG